MSEWHPAIPPERRDVVTLGDCRDLLRELPDACCSAVVTDPPYELIAGATNGHHRHSNPNNPYSRHSCSGGFMGLKWDATGIAFQPDLWREVLRVLRPGGYLLSFGGCRTQHRMVCAIEDAGFEIRDRLGMEQDTEYVALATAGVAHARRQAERARPLLVKARRPEARPGQAALAFEDLIS